MVNRKAPHFGTSTPSSSPFTMNQRRRLTSAGPSPRTPLSGAGRGGRGISSVRGFVSGATPTTNRGALNSAGGSARNSVGNDTGPNAATRNSLEISPNMLPPLPCLMTSDETLRQRIDNSPTKNKKMSVILDSAMQVMTNHFDRSSLHGGGSSRHSTSRGCSTDRHNTQNNFDEYDDHDDTDGQIL